MTREGIRSNEGSVTGFRQPYCGQGRTRRRIAADSFKVRVGQTTTLIGYVNHTAKLESMRALGVVGECRVRRTGR